MWAASETGFATASMVHPDQTPDLARCHVRLPRVLVSPTFWIIVCRCQTTSSRAVPSNRTPPRAILPAGQATGEAFAAAAMRNEVRRRAGGWWWREAPGSAKPLCDVEAAWVRARNGCAAPPPAADPMAAGEAVARARDLHPA